MKNILLSKTFQVALLQGIVGVVMVLQTSMPEIGWIAVAKSLIDMYLRAITSEPVRVG